MDRKMRKSEEEIEKVKGTNMTHGSKREQTDGQVEIKGERGRGKQKKEEKHNIERKEKNKDIGRERGERNGKLQS